MLTGCQPTQVPYPGLIAYPDMKKHLPISRAYYYSTKTMHRGREPARCTTIPVRRCCSSRQPCSIPKTNDLICAPAELSLDRGGVVGREIQIHRRMIWTSNIKNLLKPRQLQTEQTESWIPRKVWHFWHLLTQWWVLRWHS